MTPAEARFWSHVDTAGPCWLWTAGRTVRGGYGQVKWQGRVRKAHQVAWEILVGLAPAGLEPDHLCRVRLCVNPDHIEWVTKAENVRRSMAPTAIAARLNRCLQGHRFTPENTVRNADGYRRCRRCQNAGQQRRYAYRTADQPGLIPAATTTPEGITR